MSDWSSDVCSSDLDGLACRPLAAVLGFRHLYRPVWERAEPRVLPRPSDATAGVATAEDLSAYVAYGAAVDRLCAAYVARAFERMGACFPPGRPVAPAPATAALDRLFPRLWRMRSEKRRVGNECVGKVSYR